MVRNVPLELGRIVWADVADPNGNVKQRPAVVVSATETIRPGSPIRVVAVTSRVSELLPADYVLLPWHPQRHPRTGLNRRSAAVCNWVCTIMPDDVKDLAGVVPGECLFEILSKISNR